ncbi:alpha/beta fold hydrolase [Brevundimonas sp.]|uniref:alpha/beta fold hydrolase n=1 Tax=Brevundimonas sp. TaxID=1871086 RepID=UPI0035B3263A
MVFLHANGFSAGTYRALLGPLATDLRVVAPDLRGHGASRLPTSTSGRRDWSDHAEDVATLLDGLDGPLVLAGHSMGATIAALVAHRRPNAVRRLALLDPVVMPPVASRLLTLPLIGRGARRHPFVAAALRRRDRFASREAAVEAYRERGAFRGWPEDTLRDYVDSAFLDDGDSVRLACSTAWEASNYAAQGHDAWRAIRRSPAPVSILKAESGSTFTAPRASLPNAAVETLEGARHMFPLTHAEPTRAFLARALI